MRVLCLQIINPITGVNESTSPWLDLDDEYEVLEVYAYPGGRIDLRLAAKDAGTPALFDSTMFMTIDDTIPPTWTVRLEDGGALRLAPREWMRPGFWDAFFDGDPDAVSDYRRGRGPIRDVDS